MTGRIGVAAFAALIAVGCSVAPAPVGSVAGRGEVRVTGSDTMLILNQRLAAGFMREHPGVAVLVTGGGSGAGIEALIAGNTDLCAASRPLRPPELRRLYRASGRLGVRFTVAMDPLAVFVHPTNPVTELSREDLRGLLTGTIRNWKELGGPDLPVEPVIRPPVSGTYGFLQDRVLGGQEYAASAVVLPTTRGIVERVARDPAAIGYGGIAYLRAVRPCAIDGVRPGRDPEVLRRYPLTRFLYFYAPEPPSGWVGRFVQWCLGPSGQRVVEQVGYVPLWPQEAAK